MSTTPTPEVEKRTAQECGLHKGVLITYRGKETGRVLSVEGNLCWMEFFDGTASAPFIWRFGDGSLNRLHYWPNKPGDLL